MTQMLYKVEIDRETDGRWIAEIHDLPGVMVYGDTEAEALKAVRALALRVIADRIEASKSTACDTLRVSIACP